MTKLFRAVVGILLLIMLALLIQIGNRSTPETQARQVKKEAVQQATEAGKTFCATQREAIKIALHYSVTKLDGRTATIPYPIWTGITAENRKLLLFALKCTVYGNAIYDGDITIIDLNGVVISRG